MRDRGDEPELHSSGTHFSRVESYLRFAFTQGRATIGRSRTDRRGYWLKLSASLG